jgi:hypothetical protein
MPVSGAAQSLSRTDTALGAYFRAIRARKGPRQAIVAIAHKIARILYRLLKTGEAYRILDARAAPPCDHETCSPTALRRESVSSGLPNQRATSILDEAPDLARVLAAEAPSTVYCLRAGQETVMHLQPKRRQRVPASGSGGTLALCFGEAARTMPCDRATSAQARSCALLCFSAHTPGSPCSPRRQEGGYLNATECPPSDLRNPPQARPQSPGSSTPAGSILLTTSAQRLYTP